MKLQIKWTFNIRNCVASYKVKRRVVFKVLAVVSSCYFPPNGKVLRVTYPSARQSFLDFAEDLRQCLDSL